MPKDILKDLQELIHNLNKAEKRNFRLHITRRVAGSQLKYAALFDALEGKDNFQEEDFLLKNPDIKRSQLSNLKRSLYQHLLESLRRQSVNKDIELQLREQTDFAAVLYNKGLLRQSKNMLQRVTRMAERYHLDELRFEMLYREKIIELHFSGNNSVSRATALRSHVEQASQQIERINAFAGFSLQLHAQFVERGYIERQSDIDEIQAFYHASIPELPKAMTLNEKIYFNRAQYWYYYIQQDFPKSYRYSLATIQLLENQNLEYHRSVIYLKTLNQLLNSLFRMNEVRRFLDALNQLEEFGDAIESSATEQERLLLFRFFAHHRVNAAFMVGDFIRGTNLVPEIEAGFQLWSSKLESRNVITLNYKFACLYFGAGDFNRALIYLNRIIHQGDLSYRNDIHGYARILRLVTLYELGELEQLFANIRATYQYFVRQSNLSLFHQEILSFLRSTTRYYPQIIGSKFDDLKKRMQQIAEDPLARKPFYYFDIVSWLDSQVKKVPVANIIRERGLGHEQLFNSSYAENE